MIGLVALVCRFTVSPLERWMKRNDETGIYRGLKAPLFIWNRFTVPLEVMQIFIGFSARIVSGFRLKRCRNDCETISRLPFQDRFTSETGLCSVLERLITLGGKL